MSAIISDCLQYRYRLEREIHDFGDKVIAYFGVNPSTADATIDDATVRKWIMFSKMYNARKFIVGNVFAWRTPDVRHLKTAKDPIGPDNCYHLHQIVYDADLLIPCWGSRNKVPRHLRHHLDELMSQLILSGKTVAIFGRTTSADPKHPLFLSYETQLKPWNYQE